MPDSLNLIKSVELSSGTIIGIDTASNFVIDSAADQSVIKCHVKMVRGMCIVGDYLVFEWRPKTRYVLEQISIKGKDKTEIHRFIKSLDQERNTVIYEDGVAHFNKIGIKNVEPYIYTEPKPEPQIKYVDKEVPVERIKEVEVPTPTTNWLSVGVAVVIGFALGWLIF